ncbi:MAG: CDP-diacylglycerol--glycerol-3-phosphate 3-phosphatidyltransferase [bacterium]
MLLNVPNALTLLRVALTPLFVIFLFREGIWFRYVASVLFLCAALSDFYDGYLARQRGSVSRFGRFMDPLADKILTSSAFISFAALKIVATWMVYTIVVREVMITCLRMYSISRKNPLITSRLAKWKTSCQMVVILVILLLLNINATRAASGGEWEPSEGDWSWWIINGLVLAVTLLAVTTGAHYLVQNLVFPRRSGRKRRA